MLDALQQSIYSTRPVVDGLKGGSHACPGLWVLGVSIVPRELCGFFAGAPRLGLRRALHRPNLAGLIRLVPYSIDFELSADYRGSR